MAAQCSPQTIKFRMILICWLFYGMHFSLFFGGNYFDLLVSPPSDKQIQTVEEAIQSNVKVYVSQEYFEYGMIDVPGGIPVNRSFYDFNFSSMQDSKSGFVIEDFGYNYRVKRKIYSAQTERITYLSFYYLSYTVFVSMVVRRVQNFVQHLNQLVLQALASGSIEQFERTYFNFTAVPLTQAENSDYALQTQHIALPISFICVSFVINVFIIFLENSYQLLQIRLSTLKNLWDSYELYFTG